MKAKLVLVLIILLVLNSVGVVGDDSAPVEVDSFTKDGSTYTWKPIPEGGIGKYIRTTGNTGPREYLHNVVGQTKNEFWEELRFEGAVANVEFDDSGVQGDPLGTERTSDQLEKERADVAR